jgi:succinoglycan biosynthesis transport protein ExoP
VALVRDRSSQNLCHPGEAMMRLGVRELGVIPSAAENLEKIKSLRIYKSAAALEDRLNGIGQSDQQDHAPTTDDFRTLLTSIMFSGDDGNQPRLVVITSSSPQEGKTTVASNLAIAFARAGKRVLLIDGDLRKPQVHQLFGLANTFGLSNLLKGGSSAQEAQRPIVGTSVPRLSVLPSGSFTDAPGDLLFEPYLRVLLASYRERFDMVVVDSPPMMRIPDARLLGKNADGVILVARANRTTRTSIHLASQRLALDNSRLLGVVLNDWNGEEAQYPPYG